MHYVIESDHETRIYSSCAASGATTTAADAAPAAAALPNTPHSLCMKAGRLRLKGSRESSQLYFWGSARLHLQYIVVDM